jgi:hypothetical protein
VAITRPVEVQAIAVVDVNRRIDKPAIADEDIDASLRNRSANHVR